MSESNGIMTRKHPVYKAREKHWDLNIKAFKGGDDYINARLYRHDGESELSWTGQSTALGIAGGVYAGRVQRATYVNDAGRVVDKINQYLFKTPVSRAGIDTNWEANVTGRGVNARKFFYDLSELFTVNGIAWVQVDRKNDSETLLAKANNKDNVRWTIWPALSVPDWSFDDDGELRWILVESNYFNNSNPNAAPIEARLRTLFYKQNGAVFKSVFADKTVDGVEEVRDLPLHGLKRIPFVCIGTASGDPWWFDDVEGLASDLLNLDSLHSNNLGQTAFPVLVVPNSMLRNAETKVSRGKDRNGENITHVTRDILRSPGNPLVEGENEKNTCRYLMPDSQGQKQIPDEISRKRGIMYQNAGCSLLYQETRQIQTAESKQFDMLDTESALKNRSATMQDAEMRLMALSREIDATFREYKPTWPMSFDITDPAGVERIVSMVDNTANATPTMHKEKLRLIAWTVTEAAGSSDEAKKAIEEEIDDLGDDDLGHPTPSAGTPPPPDKNTPPQDGEG